MPTSDKPPSAVRWIGRWESRLKPELRTKLERHAKACHPSGNPVSRCAACESLRIQIRDREKV